MWDSTTYKAKHTLLGHDLIVNCVRFSQDSKKLYSSSGDKLFFEKLKLLLFDIYFDIYFK